MLIHPGMISAETTKDHTALRIQFNLLLVKVAAWDGLIVPSVKELAKELGTSQRRIQLFIAQAKEEGMIEEKNGQFYLKKFVNYKAKDKNNRYVKHFAFLSSPWFKSLPLAAQRVILDVLSERIYLHDNLTYRKELQSLYHHYTYVNGEKVVDRPGRFNIHSRKEFLDILEILKKVFRFDIKKNRKGKEILRIFGFQDGFETGETVENRGKHLWILQQLEEYKIFPDEVGKNALNTLVAIMDGYCQDLGFEDAKVIFHVALERAIKSQNFISMLREDLDKDLNVYFKKLMHEVEILYAEQLCKKAENLENQSDIPEISSVFRRLYEKVMNFQERWRQRLLNWKDPFRETFILKSAFVHYMADVVRIMEYLTRKKLKTSPATISFPLYNWLEE